MYTCPYHLHGDNQTWGEMTRMTRMHRDDHDRFMDEYHQRSITDAVFGTIKKMYGSHLRSKRRGRQNREVAIRVICHDIEVVARSNIKSGRLTNKSLAAMSA